MNETIPSALAGERVDRVVAMLTGLPRAEVAELVAGGAVRLRGRTVRARSARVAEGDVLDVDVPEATPDAGLQPNPDVDLPIVHVDDDVVVVDKPPGLVVHPGSGTADDTLVHGLLARFPELGAVGDPARPGIVHRLDKGTSGLLVVARSAPAYDALVRDLGARRVERRYLALAWGRFESSRGTIDAPVGRGERDRTRMTVSVTGRAARTHYEVQERFEQPAPTTLLECRLETGRTHQIRVHLAAIGHPVVGDDRYRGGRPVLPVARPFLHAWRLGFEHPVTGAPMAFTSPLPPDLDDVLARLS